MMRVEVSIKSTHSTELSAGFFLKLSKARLWLFIETQCNDWFWRGFRRQ